MPEPATGWRVPGATHWPTPRHSLTPAQVEAALGRITPTHAAQAKRELAQNWPGDTTNEEQDDA